MSGGVDSSVAAALLVKAGYDVTGAFMINFDSVSEGMSASCWRGDYKDALRVAAKLGIPLLRLDFAKEYKKIVLSYLYGEYRAGRTPNPDVMCNKFIKFGVWMRKAKELGFDKLATGHYARLKMDRRKHKMSLLKAVDKNKDQTYFLHQLTQEQLKHAIFPVGDYTKPEVRSLARRFNLSTAGKEESMGICFIGEVPMKQFLMKKIRMKKGKILFSSGEVAGEHDGFPFYTIGERIGVKSADTRQSARTKPLYVIGKKLKNNELIIGYDNDPMLFCKEIAVKDINWIAGRTPKFPLKCEVRLRHRQPLQKAVMRKQNTESGKQKIMVEFAKPQRAVTAGQFAVFYKSCECLGGGVIA